MSERGGTGRKTVTQRKNKERKKRSFHGCLTQSEMFFQVDMFSMQFFAQPLFFHFDVDILIKMKKCT